MGGRIWVGEALWVGLAVCMNGCLRTSNIFPLIIRMVFEVCATAIAIIGTGRCFKKSIILSESHGAPINLFEYNRPIYDESNQKIEIVKNNTASINPGIAMPIKAIKVNK